MSETSARAGLAEVLAGHVWDAPSYDAYHVEGCECDWYPKRGEDRPRQYLDHLVAVVLAYLAERLGSAGMREAVTDACTAIDFREVVDNGRSACPPQSADASLAAVAAGLGVALGDAGDVGGAPGADSVAPGGTESLVEDVAGEWDGPDLHGFIDNSEDEG